MGGGGGGAGGADGAGGELAGGVGGRAASPIAAVVAAVVAANTDAPGPRAVSSAEPPPPPPLSHPPPPTALPLRFVNIVKAGYRAQAREGPETSRVSTKATYYGRKRELLTKAREGPKTCQMSSGLEQGSPHESTFSREHMLGYEQWASQSQPSCRREEGQACVCGLPRGGENATQGSACDGGGKNVTRKLRMGDHKREPSSSVPSPYREHILQRTYSSEPPGPCVPSSVPSEPSSECKSENAAETEETKKKEKEIAIQTRERFGLGGHCRFACVGGLGHLVQVEREREILFLFLFFYWYSFS